VMKMQLSRCGASGHPREKRYGIGQHVAMLFVGDPVVRLSDRTDC
jgi:hypothetical protein